MRRCFWGGVFLCLSPLFHSHALHADESSARLRVGAEVVFGRCTASSHSQEEAATVLQCARSSGLNHHGMLLPGFGGVAGEDDVEGLRLIVAY